MTKPRNDGAKVPLFTMEYRSWAARIEKEHNVLVRMSLRHTQRRAVLDVYVEVWTVIGERAHTRLVREGIEYPNASQADFNTQVMTLLAATEARLEEAIALYKAQAKHL